LQGKIIKQIEPNNIYNMDCLEGLKLLADNSIDSIVTDPPYELGFMGKKWDSTGIAYNVDLWKECLRVLKPGGHMLAFGGTRTYHRMTCAIEDAGFEIRDQIQWLYGMGFPKNHNISKAIDKKLGAKGKVIDRYKREGRSAGIMGKKVNIIREVTIPMTNLAQQWDGWGTALKPANEPICLARKPLSEKTIADNVLKWGTGGINIDDCRIETDELKNKVWNNGSQRVGSGGSPTGSKEFHYSNGYVTGNSIGRFPANVILNEEAGEMLDEQSGILKSGALKPYQEKHKNATSYQMNRYKTFTQSANQGGASRFFYCAKASKKERNIGLEDTVEVVRNDGRNKELDSENVPHNRGNTPKKNHHPTVKPLKLISYLITLITPPNGISLDIFLGSGTHALACIDKGFNYIGFELEKEYFEIAQKRIEGYKEIKHNKEENYDNIL